MDDETRIGGFVTNIKGGDLPGIDASGLVQEAGEERKENAIVKTVQMETYPQPQLQPDLGQDVTRF